VRNLQLLQFRKITLAQFCPPDTIIPHRRRRLPCPALFSRLPNSPTTSHFRIQCVCRSALHGTDRVPHQDTSCKCSPIRSLNPAILGTRTPAHDYRKNAPAILSDLRLADTHNTLSQCSSCSRRNICRSTAASWNTTASPRNGCHCIPNNEFKNSPTASCSHISAASSEFSRGSLSCLFSFVFLCVLCG